MKDKTAMVVGIGLVVIVIIAALVTWGMNEYTNQTIKSNKAVTDLLIQQKDIEMMKLAKELKAAQEALAAANSRLENIREEVNAPAR